VGETESRSQWVFGLSLVQVVLLLFFAAAILYVTEHAEVSGKEPHIGAREPAVQQAGLQAGLEAAAAKSTEL
jgi:hypothetical protein